MIPRIRAPSLRAAFRKAHELQPPRLKWHTAFPEKPLAPTCKARYVSPRFIRKDASTLGGLVAQLVEQCPFKALVQGSSPCQPTISFSQETRMK